MKEEKVLLDDETIEKLADAIIKKINLNQPTYIDESKIKSWSTKSWSTNIPPGCIHCSNHPSNGGSGICHCTIGIQTIT